MKFTEIILTFIKDTNPLHMISFILFMIFSPYTFAACTLDTTSGSNLQASRTISIPFMHTQLSATTDIAVGSILYKQTYVSELPNYNVKCAASNGYFRIKRMLSSTPLALSSYSNSTYTKLYETGVPGIGVAIYRGGPGHLFPYSDLTCSAGNGLNCDVSSTYNGFTMVFIKTGDIIPGVISGSNLPKPKIQLGKDTENYVDIEIINYIGNITVTVPTCITPDYTVNLGKWNKKTFNSIGVATPWEDASIILSSCSTFSGKSSSSGDSWSVSGKSNTAGWSNNAWSLTLQPVNGVIDAANGIMALDNSNGSAATGIGIQISAGDAATADAGIIDFSSPVSGTFSSDGAVNVTLPLSARYIQTEDSVTSGTANGKLIYTVSYF